MFSIKAMSSSLSNLHDSGFQSAPSTPYSASPVLIVFTLTTLVFFFAGFFSFYFCKCCLVDLVQNRAFRVPASGSLVRISGTASPNRGLDPSQIKHLPTFPYSAVKDLRKQNHSLECAICLLEFEEDCLLRLLTVCYHVFHQECIDLWLCSHKTCPVCRTKLDSPLNGAISQELGVVNGNQNGDDRRESLTEDDDIKIDVKEDGNDEKGEGGGRIGIEKYEEQVRTMELLGKQNNDSSKMFTRSHTTGHSIVLKRGGDEEGEEHDKYKLKLPENVEMEIIRGGHNYTKSCATFMEMANGLSSQACALC